MAHLNRLLILLNKKFLNITELNKSVVSSEILMTQHFYIIDVEMPLDQPSILLMLIQKQN